MGLEAYEYFMNHMWSLLQNYFCAQIYARFYIRLINEAHYMLNKWHSSAPLTYTHALSYKPLKTGGVCTAFLFSALVSSFRSALPAVVHPYRAVLMILHRCRCVIWVQSNNSWTPLWEQRCPSQHKWRFTLCLTPHEARPSATALARRRNARRKLLELVTPVAQEIIALHCHTKTV